MKLLIYSTVLSGGNQVDGSPRALHNTEALWGRQGVGPAPIGNMDKKKIANTWKRKLYFSNFLGM